MPAPLLTTKLHLPLPGKYLVERPRLENKLEECLRPGCRLTLISAPAGFGKTTLVSAWIHNLLLSGTQPAPWWAWLTLEEEDNDAAVFWLYVISAIQVKHSEIGKQTQALLQLPNPPDLEAGLALLVNDLIWLPDPFVLILDDFHNLRNPTIHRSLSFFIDHFPAQFHLVLLSRTDPALPLALLRSRGQLIEIRMEELRFSFEDSFSFLNSNWRLNLAPPLVETLQNKTEGWIAGLQMAALSMEGRRDSAQFIQNFSASNRYILEYLVEEVLNRQAENVKDFLLRTSILEHLCAQLCDAVYPSTIDSQSMLEYIEHSNLFLIPVDEEHHWYRYHALFGDLLRNQLDRTYGDTLGDLHRSAGAWLEKNQYPIEAVNHWLAAEEVQHAAGLVEKEGTRLLSDGKASQVIRWLNRLPKSLYAASPRLNLLFSWGLISIGQFNLVEPHLQAIEQNLAGTQELQDLRSEIDATRATIAFTSGDYPKAIQLGEQALIGLSKDHHLYSGVLTGLGTSYRFSGQLKIAEKYLGEAAESAEQIQHYASAVSCLCIMGDIYCEEGYLHKAKATYEYAIELNRRALGKTPVVCMAHLGLSKLYYEWNELDSAIQIIQEALDQVEAWGNISIRAVCHANNALFNLALENFELAEISINTVNELKQDLATLPFVGSTLRALFISYLLRSGQLEQVEHLLLSKSDTKTIGKDQSLEEQLGEITARIMIGQANHNSLYISKELTKIESLLLQLQESGRIYLYLQMMIQKVVALLALERKPEATDTLLAILSQAKPEGYVRLFVDQSSQLGELIHKISHLRPDDEYTMHVFSAFPKKQTSTALLQKIGTLKQLTIREMEILRLIAIGHSNKEIAQKLSISLRTVKYHTTSIYTKLEATGRAHAVTKARELGLL